MEILDCRFLGIRGPLPLMTPGGLDPSDTTIMSTTHFVVQTSLNKAGYFRP